MPHEFATELLRFVRAYPLETLPNEVTFNRDLCRRFGSAAGTYPPGTCGGRCDAVIRLAEENVWVEVKIAQTYFSHPDFQRSNLSLFQKHMYNQSPSEHTVVNDIVIKLQSLLGKPGVTHVGELLILMWSDLYPLPADAIQRIRDLTGIDRPPWEEYHVGEWPDPTLPHVKGMLDAYYWQRPAHKE